MLKEDSYLLKALEMRGVEPTVKNAHDIYLQFSTEMKQLINKYGVNDSSVKAMIDDELDHLI
ncbi:TPA: hypothetical protein ACW0JE_004155 [Escherichia coli]